MDPITDSPGTLKELLAFLDSGGSAATIAIVWIAWQLKAKVESYLNGVNETLSILGKRLRKVEKHLGLHQGKDEDET